MPKRAVQIISDPKVARLLVDSTKRQILRHLAEDQLTQKRLGELLGIADASVSYHLKELRAKRLIRVARREPEKHGIVQKFYEADAIYFLAEYTKMPLDLRRYFVAVNLERLRGVFAILRALRGITISLSTGEMEKLAEKVAVALVDVAKERPSSAAAGRESLIMNLYGEALRRVIEDDPEGAGPLGAQLSDLGFLRMG